MTGLSSAMVAFRADQPGEFAAHVLARVEPPDHASEIVARRPAELAARPLVRVDAVERREHRPAAARIFGRVGRNALAQDARRVDPQPGEILRQERGRRADDVPAEPDRRRCL